MTPRRRANAIQAHSLHCQGLTYRQIGERMNRSVSTVAAYIKDFHAHRDEITASLAADQLVHSLAGINTPDPDLHQQHINTARELRLQVDTLDKVTERRQRRDRRIQEEQIKDFTRESKAAEELAKTLIENDLWEDPTPLNHFAATGQLLPDAPIPPISDAPRPARPGQRPGDAGPSAPNSANTAAPLSPPTSPKKRTENPTKPKSNSQKTKQTRTNPNKSEQAPATSPAKQAKSTSKRRKTKKQRRQKPEKPQLPPRPPKPTGPEYPASWDNPLGYVPRRNEEIPLVRELFGRPPR